YLCTKCEHEFEIFQPITDKSLITCPKELCAQKRWGKGKVKKKIGAGAGLIFKGSGFYITDYRSDSYKEAAKKESGSASSTSGEERANLRGDGVDAAGQQLDLKNIGEERPKSFAIEATALGRSDDGLSELSLHRRR